MVTNILNKALLVRVKTHLVNLCSVTPDVLCGLPPEQVGSSEKNRLRGCEKSLLGGSEKSLLLLKGQCSSHRILPRDRHCDGLERVRLWMLHPTHVLITSLERCLACRPARLNIVGVYTCHGVDIVYQMIHRLINISQILQVIVGPHWSLHIPNFEPPTGRSRL